MSMDTLTDNGGQSAAEAAGAAAAQEAQGQVTYIGKDTMVTIKGVTHTLGEWSDKTGINKATLSFRILHKWSDDRILSKPSPTGRWATPAGVAAKKKKKAERLAVKTPAKKSPPVKVAKVRTKETVVQPADMHGIAVHGEVVIIDMNIYETIATKSEMLVLLRRKDNRAKR